MNQIRNYDFFSFFSVHPALPAKSAFSKIAGFFYQNFFHFSLSLCALSLQKEPTGENSAIFEQFFSERAFPLPIVPRAIIDFFLLNYPARASAEERGTTFYSQQNRHFA